MSPAISGLLHGSDKHGQYNYDSPFMFVVIGWIGRDNLTSSVNSQMFMILFVYPDVICPDRLFIRTVDLSR